MIASIDTEKLKLKTTPNYAVQILSFAEYETVVDEKEENKEPGGIDFEG